MIVLYILLGIVLFFALLLSLHLKVYLVLDDKLHLRAGLGPVMFTLAPKKKKTVRLSDFTYEKHQKRLAKEALRQEKKSAKKAARDAKKKEAQSLTEQAKNAAAETEEEKSSLKLSAILELIQFVLEEWPKFCSYVKTDVRRLHVTVGGKDADQTARTYGKIAALTSLLVELLYHKTDMRKPKPGAVDVRADFLAEKTRFHLNLRFRLRLFSIVRVLCHTLVWFIRQKVKENHHSS